MMIFHFGFIAHTRCGTLQDMTEQANEKNKITRICDRCGELIEEGMLRYEARIQVYAAYDPLNITFEDLTKDHSEEIRKIIEQCKNLSEEELMKGVYVDFLFDLCPSCQKTYIRDPLGLEGHEKP